jgi:lipid-binding SYLF domain-containing protein
MRHNRLQPYIVEIESGEPENFMQRRDFIFSMATTFTGALLAACSTGPIITDTDINKHRRDIDTGFYATLERLGTTVSGSRGVIEQARGVLIFPTVLTSESNLGSLYGEGVLRVANAMAGYYQMQSWSVAIPAGMPAKEIALLYFFMAQDVLDDFRASDNWVANRDAPVIILKTDKSRHLNKYEATAPILALTLGSDGPINTITNKTLRELIITPLEL